MTGKIQSFERFNNFRHFRFIKPIRKDEKDEKLTIWLNSELFYWSFLFEIVNVNYVFCRKELLQFGLILISGVSGVSGNSVESTWLLPTCYFVLKFLF